jgi:diadenosine tetraphosphate (Ap4A) HIT family hydrolase
MSVVPFSSLTQPLYEIISEKSSTEETIIYRGTNMKIIVSERPLAEGSIKIMPLSGIQNFSEWLECDHIESYNLIQCVQQVWKDKGITDYLVYGKQCHDSTFNWEVVPYPKEGFRFWKQLKVLWNIIFEGPIVSQVERDRIIKDFKDINSFSKPELQLIETIENVAHNNDAFCNPEVIDRQQIYEGENVNVLYNYAPIEKRQHFLLTSKQHRSAFSNLTEAEYLESMLLSRQLIEKKNYPAVYLFHKTGIEAGQTVDHFHEHLLFIATKVQDLFGKLTILKNMVFGSSPLSEAELKSDVELLRREVQEVFQ